MITGTVRQEGVGVEDITVSLTGPVATTTTTDAEGRYIFAQLPAGTYTLKATRVGAQVVPAERTVELGLENVTDEDFTAGGVVPSDAPTLSFITPSSTFVGTAFTNLKILGTNFTPSTVVEFNGTALQTSFVSSVELTAVIASSSLTRVGAAEITARTPPPGGGTSTPAAFVVIAAPDNPLIEGRVTVGSFPAGVAIHPTRKIALVTNESGDNVSVIDLETMEVTATLDVGRFPIGVAVDETRDLAVVTIHSGLGIAVVANRGNDNVSLIDLDARTNVATIPVEGAFPRGVAIHEGKNLAVVANAGSNTISLIDLGSRQLIRNLSVGTAPTGVGVHELTSHAVVSNSGVERGSTDLGGLTTASIVDLEGEELVEDVPVGSAAFGVDVDEASQMAVVANFGSNDVTIIRVPFATPRLSDVQPKTLSPGVVEHEITVTGTGFAPISVVTLNGQPLPTTFVSTTELRATLSGELLEQLLQVSSISADDAQPVRFDATAPLVFGVVTGDKVSEPSADPLSARILTLPTGVSLFTMEPTQGEVGTSTRLTLRGQGITGNTVAHFGGLELTGSDTSATEMAVDVPGSALSEPGDVAVFLENPAIVVDGESLGGGRSQSLTFTIEEPAPTVLNPVITSVSPSSVLQDSASVVLSISGRNFAPDITTVTFGDQALDATVTENLIEAPAPDALFETVGTVSGFVDSLGRTASFSVTVLPKPVAISAIDPTVAATGLESLGVTVTGANFPRDTTITVDGTGIPTDFVNATTVTGTIPSVFLATLGTLTISVDVPLGVDEVAGLPLVIRNPTPVLEGLEPSEASLAELPIRVTGTGQGIIPGTTVHVDGEPVDTIVNSATSVSFELTRGPTPGLQALSVDGGSIPSFLAVSRAGTLMVTLVNPEPGGGTSDPLPLTIRELVPKIDAVDPDSVPFSSSVSTTLTVTGSGFTSNSRVALDGSTVPHTFIDANTLQFDLPAGTTAGDHDVTVTNQVTSNSVSLRVTARPPIVSSVQPDRGVAGENHSVEVNGENFIEGADVLVDGQSGGGRFNGSTSMSVTLPPAPAGTRSISVKNPDGAESNAVDFTDFEAPAPTVRIVSVTPDPSTAQAGQLLTIILEGLGERTQLFLDDRPLTYTQADTRTVTIVAPAFTDGQHVIKAINVATAGGGGGTSTFSFTTGTAVLVPNEIIVFNDVNIFDSEGMDDDFDESPGGANPNNKLLARNIVSFTSSGSRNSGTVVQFDCGRSSGYTDACTSETDLMKAEFTSVGLSTTTVNSSSGSMTSIPSDVKVLFLWLPRVVFTGVEINTMKQFVNDGGRIVFVGEHGGFYDSISSVANVFLKDMGAKSEIKGGSFDSGFNTLPAASLNTTGHQVMTGLTGLEHAAASEINPLASQDTFLFKERDDSNITQAGTAVLAAALKVTTDPITTSTPTLTSVSPTNPVAGQSIVMTLTGTNFTPGATVTLTGGLQTSATVTNVEFVSSTTLRVTISIDSGHSGGYTFKVTTGNGQSGTAGFTIVNDKATVTSVSPNSGTQGATVNVTITGNQFTGATSVNTSAGIVLSFTVNSNTEISAVLLLNVSTGAKFVSVTNAAGSSGSVTFTINSSAITSASSLTITSLAGSQGFGTEDGTGSAAAFNTPNGSVVYNSNLYVADFVNHTIRQIVIATGVVTTLAGSAGNSGTNDGTGSAARFNGPTDIASDGSGNLFVTDQSNHTIRKIVAATGAVTTLAGTATQSGTTDGTGSASRFNLPFGITCCGGSPSALYVSDSGNHSIREVVVSTGVVTTPVGSVAGTSGFVNDDDNAARFNTPKGLVEASGSVLFVADSGNNAIRKVTTGGTHTVTTFAGSTSGLSGSDDGTSTAARFNGPVGMAADATNLYVGDRLNHTIRQIQMSNQAVTTFAGTAGTSGFVEGNASTVRFNQPGFVTQDSGNLYVSDELNHAIRKTSIASVSFSTLAGSPNPKSGSVDETGDKARLNFPQGAAIDGAGNIYVSDTNNHVIRKVASGTGAVTTLAGSSGTSGTADGTGTAAQFNLPESGVVVGNFLYVADVGNHTIRKVNIISGVVTTFAGQAGTSGFADGTGTGATFSSAHAIASDGTSLFVADKDNHTIRKIVLSTAVVSTFAGTAGSNGFTNATGTAARFDLPLGITATSTTVYVSEGNNHSIRAITISSGAVTTLAGAGTSGSTDATGTSAEFNFPHGITTDGTNIYVADRDNHTIRKVVISSGVVTTLAGSAGTSGFVNASGSSARFNSPMDVVGNGTNLFVIDGLNHQVRKGAQVPDLD